MTTSQWIARALLAGTAFLFSLPGSARAAKPWLGTALKQGTGGAEITRVVPTSPAARAGLKKGDVFLLVGSTPTPNPGAVLRAVGRAGVGSRLRITVRRGGRSLEKTLHVAALPPLDRLIRLFLLNTKAPNFSTPLTRGGKLWLSSLRGKVVLLYFWASWCDSCKLNMNKLKKLYSRYKARGFELYSMGRDKQFATLKKTTALLQLPFPVGWNRKNRVGRLYKSEQVPATVIIDRGGVIRDYLQGSSFSYSRLDRVVSKLLGR